MNTDPHISAKYTDNMIMMTDCYILVQTRLSPMYYAHWEQGQPRNIQRRKKKEEEEEITVTILIVPTHTGCVSDSSYQCSSVFLVSGYSLDNLHCWDDKLEL